MKKLDTSKKENRLAVAALIISILICLVTISYAAWSSVYQGKKENIIKTGTVILSLNDRSNSISLLNAVPLSDNSGMMLEPYTFSLQNAGTTAVVYELSIIDDNDTYSSDQCSDKKLPWNFLRYSFTSDNSEPIIKDLSDNSGVLETGTLKENEKIDFSLKMWLNSSATTTEMGKHFHGKIKVEALQNS